MFKRNLYPVVMNGLFGNGEAEPINHCESISPTDESINDQTIGNLWTQYRNNSDNFLYIMYKIRNEQEFRLLLQGMVGNEEGSSSSTSVACEEGTSKSQRERKIIKPSVNSGHGYGGGSGYSNGGSKRSGNGYRGK